MSDELWTHQKEALAYAKRHPDAIMGELLQWAVSFVICTLMGDEKKHYLEESVPQGSLSFLLCVHLLDDLLRRRSHVRAILEGGPSPPAELLEVAGREVPNARNVERAVAYAHAHPDQRARALASLAVAVAARALRGDDRGRDLVRRLPEGEVDLLLYARIVSHLVSRDAQVLEIMAGDFGYRDAFW